MRRLATVILCALAIVPLSARGAELVFGADLSLDYSPLLFSVHHDYRVERGAFQHEESLALRNLHWVFLQGAPALYFGPAMLFVPLAFQHLQGEFEAHTPVTIEGKDDRVRLLGYEGGWKDFRFEMGGVGLGAGGRIPLNAAKNLRLALRAQGTFDFGRYASDLLESDGAYGYTLGGDLVFRYHPGKPDSALRDTGFFVGAGLGARYFHRRVQDEEDRATTRIGLRGFVLHVTLLDLGLGN